MTDLTHSCRRALALARLHTAERWAPSIEPEDLLVASIEAGGQAARLLDELEISPGAIIETCRRRLPDGRSAPLPRGPRGAHARRVDGLPAAVHVRQASGVVVAGHVQTLAHRGAMFALVDFTRARRVLPAARLDLIERVARLYAERGGRLVLLGKEAVIGPALEASGVELDLFPTIEEAELALQAALARGELSELDDPSGLPWSARTRLALRQATRIAGRRNEPVSTADLFVGLQWGGGAGVRSILDQVGVTDSALELLVRSGARRSGPPTPSASEADLIGLREQTFDVQLQLADESRGLADLRERIDRLGRLELTLRAGLAVALAAAVALGAALVLGGFPSVGS